MIRYLIMKCSPTNKHWIEYWPGCDRTRNHNLCLNRTLVAAIGVPGSVWPEIRKFWRPLNRSYGPNLVLILSHFIIKGTEDNMNVNWHQDQRYWLHGVGGDHLSTVWMPFNPATRENGGYWPKTNQPMLHVV